MLPLDRPWRIAVVGPGALGTLYAGLLALDGHDVRVLGRRAEQAELIERDGLTIERDGEARRVSVRAGTDPAALGPVDLAIVLVKATDTAAAAPSLPALLADGAPALSLQNGLGNAEKLAAFADASRIAIGMTILSTEMRLLQNILHLTSLTGAQWLVCIIIGLLLLLVDEVFKVFLRRSRARRAQPTVAAAPAAAK